MYFLASSYEVKLTLFAQGMPYLCIKFLAKTLLDSIRAAP
jgi:hypothetical protein